MMDVQCVFFSYTGTTPAPYSDRPDDDEDDLIPTIIIKNVKNSNSIVHESSG